MKNSKSVALHNLGCKVNAYELDVLQQMLQENGYRIVSFDEEADIYLVNTCSVTNIADRKSRQMLHKAKKKNPNAIVVAMGCYVQMNEEESSQDTMIDLLIGNNKKKDVLAILETYLQEKEQVEVVHKTLHHTTVIDINNTYEYEEMKRTKTGQNVRANVKIQDGCNQFCTYCIIPYARGRVRSRDGEEILAEITSLVASGYVEVVLTGIHISSYGIDKEEGTTLLDLIEKIHQIEGLERIRIGSLEPRIITETFAKRMGELYKICPHFHLSLQSGSDAVLRRMNRRYTSGEYYDKVQLLRRYVTNPAITTDIIVGFPGESHEEFQETLAFVKQIAFAEVHVFKYSKRKGTKAAVMEGQVADQLKAKRSEELLEITASYARKYQESLLGVEVEVLWEEEKSIHGVDYLIGHTRQYCKVVIPKGEGKVNCLALGHITGRISKEIMKFSNNSLFFLDE